MGSMIEGTIGFEPALPAGGGDVLLAGGQRRTSDGSYTVVLRLPDNSTRTARCDGRGYYSFPNLPPGVYDLDVVGKGSVGRGILLDGANTVVFDYALPDQASTLRGSVIGGQAGLDVVLRCNGDVRRTTVDDQGRYEFRLLPAGTYSVSIGGQTVDGILLDGLNTVDAPPIDVRVRRYRVGGQVCTSAGAPAGGIVVQLSGPDGPNSSQRETTTNSDGSYAFVDLLGGAYTVRSGEVSQSITLTGETSVCVDLVIPAPLPAKLLQLVLLFGPPQVMGTKVNLRLAQRYIRAFGPTVSFRVEEAERAQKVLVVGDLQSVGADIEDRLRAAGCTVGRVGGTPYAVEDGLARLVGDGAAMPKTRAGVILPRHRRAGTEA
jgi:hypothetical protein